MKNNATVTGVGCFANPQTLARVLRRVVEAYLMGSLETSDHATVSNAAPDPGSIWLRHLLAGQPAVQPGGSGSLGAPARINGFFLGFGLQGPRLSIFTGRKGCGGQHFTAGLEQIKAWRRKRLH